jgi:hypothetical protein
VGCTVNVDREPPMRLHPTSGCVMTGEGSLMERTTSFKRWTVSRLACVVAGVLLGSGVHGERLHAAYGQPHPVRGMQKLLVVNARGGIGSTVSPAGQIIMVEQGQATGIVTRGLHFPYQGGLASAANGMSVVYGNETAGVWSVRLNGTSRHRLVATPRSTFRNLLGVEHVAWSVQGRVAFAVNTVTDVVVAPNQDPGFGIWVMPFHGGGAIGPLPRRVVSLAQLPAQTAASIGSLAWSRNGQQLVTSPTPSRVLSLDLTHGTTRVLLSGGGEAAVSPTTGDLAYVTGAGHPSATSSLWIAGAGGRHRRLIVSVHGSILHPVWSPDGRKIAYIGSGVSIGAVGGTALHVVTIASRIDQVILRADRSSHFLLPYGYFADLAWVPTLQR